MTKWIHRLADQVGQQIQAGPWPPKSRFYIDSWFTLVTWGGTGEHVFRLRGRAPVIAPDLPLATAPLKHKATCFILDDTRDECIILARIAPEDVIPVDSENSKYLQSKQPLLTYFSVVMAEKHWGSGFINLLDQPTPRDLKIIPGTIETSDGHRLLGVDDVSDEGVRIAKVLPWFYA